VCVHLGPVLSLCTHSLTLSVYIYMRGEHSRVLRGCWFGWIKGNCGTVVGKRVDALIHAAALFPPRAATEFLSDSALC
jgi:hypothetical protein